jgi:hypothetical protein
MWRRLGQDKSQEGAGLAYSSSSSSSSLGRAWSSSSDSSSSSFLLRGMFAEYVSAVGRSMRVPPEGSEDCKKAGGTPGE